MSFINFQSFDPLSWKQRENKPCAVSKDVYHPNTNTLTKNWADMWDFANSVKRGWSDLNVFIVDLGATYNVLLVKQ